MNYFVRVVKKKQTRFIFARQDIFLAKIVFQNAVPATTNIAKNALAQFVLNAEKQFAKNVL
jgi:hypothetical protein